MRFRDKNGMTKKAKAQGREKKSTKRIYNVKVVIFVPGTILTILADRFIFAQWHHNN